MKNMLVRNLVRYRKKFGYSQEEIASILGVTLEEIQSWEDGTSNVDMEYIKKLSAMYKVSVEEFMSGEGMSFKFSRYGLPINIGLSFVLYLTFFLPIINEAGDLRTGFGILFSEDLWRFDGIFLYMFLLYMGMFSTSLGVYFLSEKAKYIYRYCMFIVMLGMISIFYMMLVYSSNIIAGTRVFMFVIYCLILLNTVIDILVHRDLILNEKRQDIIRKIVFYITYVVIGLLSILYFYELGSDIFEDTGNFLLRITLLIFDIFGMWIILTSSTTIKWINLILSIPPLGFLLTVIVITMEYDIYASDMLYMSGILLFAVSPLILVNYDYITLYIKHLLEDRGKLYE